MSEIWLGTIAQPYGPASFWVAANDKQDAKQCVEEELQSEWGNEPPFEWTVCSGRYEYYEGMDTAELRKIMWLD